jgi:hypothetical protein
MKNGRAKQLLWLATAVALATLVLFPVSYRITRIAIVALSFAAWFGMIGLLWKHRALRLGLFAVTILAAGFLMLPSRGSLPQDTLHGEYLAALKHYEGVVYYWGGENRLGIDCSGLIRRGLIDAFLRLRVRKADGSLIRRAIHLWWHDCTASALGEEYRGLTSTVISTPNLNELDHGKILPGDLAVTQSGVHIMAYLGGQRWIEADPDAGKVMTITAPSSNIWFQMPMHIVRWTAMQEAR